MIDCYIIADDLTGACDAAVQFTRAGACVSVMLAMDAPPPHANVIAISTDSRNLPESEVPALMQQAADYAAGRMIFKKIDSVLRGNPGAEIQAALEAFHLDAAIATPAFPAMGRMVDATNNAEVARLLHSDVHVVPNDVAQALASVRIVSSDATTEDDLITILAQAQATNRRILYAGSAGLAAALSKSLPQRSLSVLRVSAMSAPPTFVIGSDHPVTLAQLTHLRQSLPEALIHASGPILNPAALVLSGGDTAAAICRQAEARRIDLYGEILPGIPWGILRCGRFDGIPVVTKSGGFGAPDALTRVAEFFQ